MVGEEGKQNPPPKPLIFSREYIGRDCVWIMFQGSIPYNFQNFLQPQGHFRANIACGLTKIDLEISIHFHSMPGM